MKKRVLSFIIVVMLIFSSMSFAFGADAADAATTKITILHTNDTHGRVLAEDGGFGFARIAALYNQLKADNPNTLLIDAGDTLHGKPIINLSKGEYAVKILSAAGYSYMTPGNHDFNYGQDRLVELSKMADFKVLSANIKSDGKEVFTPYDIVDIGGVKVAFFGLTTPETAYKTSPSNVEGIVFDDCVNTSKAVVAELEGKADVIVAVAHVGVDESSVITSVNIAEQVEGIDVIIDGHSHTVMEEGTLVNDTLIAQTGDYDVNLGCVEIEVKDGKVVSKSAKLLHSADYAELVPDEKTAAVIEEAQAAKDAVTKEVVATVDIPLDGERENVRTKETNLGNLSADAVRTATKADIGFVNGGNIRVSLEPGEITLDKVLELFPFSNILQTIKLTGAEVREALEVSVSGYPATQGGFLQVSGLDFSFDPSKEAGSRVAEVNVGGEPIDPAKEYVVAINDFLIEGGDGFTMFVKPVAGEFGTYEEIFADYLNSNGTEGCEVTGRITVLEAEQNAPVEEEPVQEEPAPVEEEPEKTKEDPLPQKEVPATGEQAYTVEPGDSLWKIALKYNTTWQALAKYNNLVNPNLILPGQIIKIPAAELKPAA